MSTVGDTIMSGGFRVPSLTGKDNYKTWKINMVNILSDMDLLDHIEKKPDELHAADATAAVKAKFVKLDQKTLGQIRLQCTPFAGVYIENSVLVKEAWETLHTEFQDSGASSRFIFRCQLCVSKMAEGEDLDIHLQKTRHIYQDLWVTGDGLPESEFLMLLFCSLPSSWETFIASIDFTDVDSDDEATKNKAVASILVHLRVKGTHRKSLIPNPTSSSAFNTQGAFHSQGSNPTLHWKPDKSNTECKYCHKKGHWLHECRKCISDEKRKNANITSQKGNDLKNAFTSSTTQFRNAWIGNTMADHHIIHDHHSFTEYHTLLGQSIKGVGGIQAPIHGFGTVAITMNLHSSSHSVELRDCYHIPETDGNLLSLCRFDQSRGEI